MARTIRRKSATFNYEWVLRDWCFDAGYIRRVEIDRHSPDGREKLARYHGDAGCGRYGSRTAPHWYRRSCNKKASNTEKQYLHLWKKMVDGQYEIPKPTRVSNASWYW